MLIIVRRSDMRSVPPRGSGWVRPPASEIALAKGIKLWDTASACRTHPLPRGGTDVMKQAPPSPSAKLRDQSLIDMRLKGGAMDTIYIGVDFHARQQTICYLKTETGELVTCELKHQDKEQVRAFYKQFQGHVIIGLEASGYSPWFEAMLEQLGCEVWLGHATEIRRRARWRQKNDRRDAELILDLMLHHEFPRLHRPPVQSREVLRMLRYRQKLIK